jgi:hypothetical protein
MRVLRGCNLKFSIGNYLKIVENSIFSRYFHRFHRFASLFAFFAVFNTPLNAIFGNGLQRIKRATIQTNQRSIALNIKHLYSCEFGSLIAQKIF